MKIFFALPAFYLLLLPLAAQSEKDAVLLPTHHSSLITHHSTRAVVVGISDYQDPAIPDLQFAHRDAEAFAAWLQSPAGGSVPPDNIQLLLNEKATLGRVAMALTALLDQCREGDEVIIYFSGHGDVETKTLAQPGYWLCYDAPPVVYMSGGCLTLWNLQDVVSTLSLQRKARVLLISDACHAGKLAGSEIGGPQATTGNLARQFANETKILSCQPGEFSLEGAQWGGGRGCFSYHLTDGLYGLADRNQDDLITLFELGNYLGERVPEETAPHRQFPFVVGDMTSRVARVDAPTLAQIKAGKAGAHPTLEKIEPRGMEDWVLAKADSSIRELYAAFNAALERGELLEPKGTSADDYYQRLIMETELEPVHGLMTRNFAAALVDESQKVTNKLLKTDPNVVSDMFSRPFAFEHMPGYIGRAIELLGEQHFMYRHLKAKQYFFEGKTCLRDKYPDLQPDSVVIMAVRKYEEALRFDSSAAYAHVELGFLRYYVFFESDLAWYNAQKALILSPNWVYANYLAGNVLRFDNPRLGEVYLLKAIALDSTFLLPYQELVWNYLSQGNMEKSNFFNKVFIEKVKTLLAAEPDKVPVYYRTLLGGELWRTGQLEEAKEILLEAERLSNGQSLAVYQYLCAVYTDLGQYEEATEAAIKSLTLAPGNGAAASKLINKLTLSHQPDEVIKALEAILQISGKNVLIKPLVYAFLAEAYLEVGQPEKARPLFQKALGMPFEDHMFTGMNCHGRALLGLGDRAAMEQTIEDALEKWPDEPFVYYQAACLYSLARQEQAALKWLEKALEKNIGPDPLALINGDSDWNNIRDSLGFKALLKKHFPDQVKD